MKAAGWVLSQAWAIQQEVLETILAIAERRNESPEAVEQRLGRPLDNTHKVTVRDGVALIPVVGPISRYADLFSEISGATAIDTLATDFRSALDDRSVRAIVLNLDSPGGTVAGVAEFAEQVRAARGSKPIVAYVGAQAQSAGYWIASAADRIVADSTAMIGSIGVVMGMRLETGQKKVIEFVSSQSPHKRPDPATESGKAQIQGTVDDLADVFVAAVAANRGVSAETVLSDFGKGGSFVGAKAVEAGMADGLGSLESVIACLAKGEMPCPPSPKKKPARKAESQPRRAAMSEPNQTETVSSADRELAELRKQLQQANERAESEARGRQEATRARIESEGKVFASEIIGACKATPGERQTILDAFSLAAQDDLEHPIAGRPNARQDALRSVYEKRTPHTLTKEVVAGDAGQKTRALASDPAGEDAPDPEAEELEALDASTRKWAAGMNGKAK